jgi:diguanylate cyclase (GGDEF)-like protein
MLHIAIPRRPAARLRTLLDASVIGLVAAAVAWAYVLEPIAYTSETSTVETILGLAYPVGDLLLVFGLAVAALRRPREQAGLILGTLGIGLILFLIADFAFAILSQSDDFVSGSLIDVMWLAGYALIATSAVWQHRWRVAHETDDSARISAAWRQAIPLALLLPAFVWAWAMAGDYSGIWTPAFLVAALALVIARSFLAMTDVLSLNRELDDGASRLEAANQELSANGRLLNKLLVEAVALSRRDSLTGLLNHASITEELKLAMKDHPSGVVVAMLDLDEMKRINDEGGHQAGDEALRFLAKLLESQQDLVAGRYGGDEFLVYRISPGGSLEALERQLDEVLGVLATRGIGVSYGVASYPVDASEMAELVDRADKRLYRAKRTRKNLSQPNAAA